MLSLVYPADAMAIWSRRIKSPGITARLVVPEYEPHEDHATLADIVMWECHGDGYSPMRLTGCQLASKDGTIFLLADNLEWPRITVEAGGVVLCAGEQLVGYIGTGTLKPVNTALVIKWPRRVVLGVG